MWLSTLPRHPGQSILSVVKYTLTRVAVMTATLTAGLLISASPELPQKSEVRPTLEVVAAAPEPPAVKQRSIEDEGYPEDLGTGPFDIASFISAHPRANLERLWQRLKIKRDPAMARSNDIRTSCETNIYEYNLDGDADREVVLQIKEGLGEVYRYLVFKDPHAPAAKFLGHIDVWAKYPPAGPIVLMSNGQPWLIVQSTAATGSGLAAWLDYVYDVSTGRVRPIGAYLARVKESGFASFPTKHFVGSLVSSQVKGGNVSLTVSYRVDYWMPSDLKRPLFTKRQTAVLKGLVKDGGALAPDPATSQIAPREYFTIYNFDSMEKNDFLQYNRAELRALARGRNSEKKEWLREFLTTCANSALKRELSALLK